MVAVKERHETDAGTSPLAPGGEQHDAPVEVFELTCGLTGWAHLSAVSAVEEAIATAQGWFTALCGARIPASSLGSGNGAACFACRDSGVVWRHAGGRGETR